MLSTPRIFTHDLCRVGIPENNALLGILESLDKRDKTYKMKLSEF